MKIRSTRWLVGITASLAAIQGCQHCGSRPACPPPVPPPPPAPSIAPYVPPPGVPTQPYQPPSQPILQPPVAPPPNPAEVRQYGPPAPVSAQPSWRAQGGGTPGYSDTGDSYRSGVRLQTPDFNAPLPVKPAVVEERPVTPSLPVGIPQFGYARDQVASGLKPLLEGLDWLKDNNFRTVVHVRLPGKDDSADRRQVEQRGLRFLSLEVSPQTLSKTTIEDFNHIVADPSNLPLFVYDNDGALAGGLWYLHFRMIDHASDQAARQKAARLGLPDDQNSDHKLIWLAIQKLLADQAR